MRNRIIATITFLINIIFKEKHMTDFADDACPNLLYQISNEMQEVKIDRVVGVDATGDEGR